MNQKELKKVIKHLVRECLMEVLSEQMIETTVRRVVKESYSASRENRSAGNVEDAISTAQMVLKETRQKEEARARPDRNEILRKVLGDNAPAAYASIMEDTINSDNPLLMEGSSDAHDPERGEVVPEHTLSKTGLFRDYSKFVK